MKKAIGIGGAGGKVAVKLDAEAVLVNVSQLEMSKVNGGSRKIVATIHGAGGQYRGARKDPQIGKDGYVTIKRELNELIKGRIVFSSTGGGTGSGICTGILEDLAKKDNVDSHDKTLFGFILPYAELESQEFVQNSSNFLTGPLSAVINSGNSGNIFLFSNRVKFTDRVAEDDFNENLIDSLKVFLSIPQKNADLKLLDEQIDIEDFEAFISKPYFNHFCYFTYDQKEDFGKQLRENSNPYLLPSEDPIEVMFLLEVPQGADPTMYIDIVKYFQKQNVAPIYSVVENPDLEAPFITVACLYSREPAELLDDFIQINEKLTQAKMDKSLDQHVKLPQLKVDLTSEAKRAGKKKGVDEDVLATLKRLGKL